MAEQIESILSQKRIQVFLLVRDDGSTDTTRSILASYAGYGNVRFYAGKNIGAAKSYFDLLARADAGMDFYAFSDQDDIWHPLKLYCAAEALHRLPKELPLLYAGEVIRVSQNLDQKTRIRRGRKICPSFGNALVENICMGCTEVFNEKLLRLAAQHPPKCGIWHDWRLYMTAAYFGRVIFDRNPQMFYRQHAHNQVGMQKKTAERWLDRFRRAGRLRGLISEQSLDFARAYQKEIEKQTAGKQNQRKLMLVSGCRRDFRKRIAVVTDRSICRQSLADQAVYKVLFLIGYL